MAILKLGAMFDKISGKVGGQSICNYPTQQILRNITQTNKFATPRQSKKRAFTAYLANSWRQLTTAQQQGWSATAVNYTYVNRVGNTVTRNGYQTFSFCNQNLNLIEIPLLASAPIYVPVTEPKINVTDISSGNFTIQSNNASSDYLFALFGVANLSNGQAAQLGLMRFIGNITAAQLTAGYDVVSDMEVVFGTLTFPNKMAITVDPINQTTGNRKQFVEIIENIDLPMILEFTVANGDTLTIPFSLTGTYSGSVDFGDGTVNTFTAWNSAGLTHTYTLGGVYRVLIYGTFSRISFFGNAMASKLTNVYQFGTNSFTQLSFYSCSGLAYANCVDTPTLSAGTLFSSIFRDCSLLTTFENIENWDTSNITTLLSAFRDCKLTANLNNWNISGVTTLAGCFYQINGNITVANWDTSNVTAMDTIAYNSKFSSDVSAWDVSNVTTFQNAFYNCDLFNSDVSAWDVSSCSNFYRMFFSCALFNSNLASWDIRLATNMVEFGLGTVAWSVANWNATLVAWDALVNPPLNIVISVKPTATGTGATARLNLIATWGWTINQNV